jgi:hypothetical protein
LRETETETERERERGRERERDRRKDIIGTKREARAQEFVAASSLRFDLSIPREGGSSNLRPTTTDSAYRCTGTFIARQELRIERGPRVRRVEWISPWSGENNGRTFYYQIDLWISSRVPTTEVYMAASAPSCFIRR